jgi:hypothetical protein
MPCWQSLPHLTLPSFLHFRPSGTHTSSYCSAAYQKLTDCVKLRQTPYSNCFLSNSALRVYYIWHRAVWYVCTNVSEEHTDSIFRVWDTTFPSTSQFHSWPPYRRLTIYAPFSMFSSPKFSCLWPFQAFVFFHRETVTAPNYRHDF